MALSTAAKAAAAAQRTDKALIHFLTITHADMAELYICDNTADLVRGGHNFIGTNFDCKLPDDVEDRLPNVQLQIQNIDRAVVTWVRSISAGKQLSVQINCTLADSPDTTERGPFDFVIRNITTTALWCVGEMTYEDIINDPYPKDLMSGNNFPGLVS